MRWPLQVVYLEKVKTKKNIKVGNFELNEHGGNRGWSEGEKQEIVARAEIKTVKTGGRYLMCKANISWIKVEESNEKTEFIEKICEKRIKRERERIIESIKKKKEKRSEEEIEKEATEKVKAPKWIEMGTK